MTMDDAGAGQSAAGAASLNLGLQLPAKCALAAGLVADYPLLAEEASGLQQAAAKRRRQFASGRHFARLAIRKLTGRAAPVLRDSQGRPAWPNGLIGSIAHSERLAAGVAASEGLRGVGIDLERADRLGGQGRNAHLHLKLFTAAERARTWEDPRQGAVIFSAKEAGYKAINPIAGRCIGFQEVEVALNWRDGTFRIRYLGNWAPNRLLERGIGRFRLCGDQVAALFLIP